MATSTTLTESASVVAPATAGAPPITRLLISCPDRAGIVAAVSRFLHETGANIVSSDQHSTDPRGGTFFMRMEFNLPLDEGARVELERRFGAEIGVPFEMRWRMADAQRPKRVAVLVSRYEHCLLDLLWRGRRGEIEADIALVASNHEDLRTDVEAFGIPYHHVPVAKGEKAAAEARLLELLEREGPFDLVVLARYMQILSADFLERVGGPVINIHHSFLPAFAGAGPYQRAKERGVKLVGATAHYVTEDLDAGPIIDQDVIRVTHRDDAATLERLGADVERLVLARAVLWHCEDRVLVDGNTTVVF
ncbi:MAG: purU [Solirubrobacterales bacterium]|nr:purU [Solirubrobacterales bacterium]